MFPSATPQHNAAGFRLAVVLAAACGPHRVVVPDAEVDLQLVPDADPATVRAPDVVVVTRAGFDRVKRAGGLLRAGEAVLVVEVISPGSRRTDRLVKLAEYADAGIGHYWMIDLDGEPKLIAGRLVDGRYDQGEPVAGEFRTELPFPVVVDLAGLA